MMKPEAVPLRPTVAMTNQPNPRPDAIDDLVRRLDQAEQQSAELRAQLEHSHRLAMIGTLAAGVIHEINNILTPVLGYAQMAGSHPNDPEFLAKVAEKTTRGLSQARGIADSMLELARPRGGDRNDTEPVRANVLDVCRAAIACLGRAPAKDGIRCEIDVPGDLTCAARPLALQQVLLNLLINAVQAMKSMPSRDRVLTIRAVRTADHGSGGLSGIASAAKHTGQTDMIRIEVSDTGPGIPVQIRDSLFKPFVSVQNNSSSSPGSGPGVDRTSGCGLGLSVCRTLVEAAGGTIAAQSGSQSGTTFIIVLPEYMARSCKLAG
jgi:two-component system, NtrC family, sensor kinase